jgi:hypothetical protein
LIISRTPRATQSNPKEFFTVLHVFLLESGGIWLILGILWNCYFHCSGIAVDSGMATGITETESHLELTGTESTKFF